MKGIILFEPMENQIEITWSEDVERYIKERRMPAICVIPEAKFEMLNVLKERFGRAAAAEQRKRWLWRGAFIPASVELRTFIADVNRNIIEWASFVAHLLNLNAQRAEG